MAFVAYPADFADRMRAESHTLGLAGVHAEALDRALDGIESPHANLRDMLERAMNPASYGVGPSRILGVINGGRDPEALRTLEGCVRIETLYMELLDIQQQRQNAPFDMGESL
ncbi:MAG: hypothetical protein J0L97_10685 [Alphaproteobacteria bacterium]|nr:hypothetical protein [Alphaproteobacteria bacterium]